MRLRRPRGDADAARLWEEHKNKSNREPFLPRRGAKLIRQRGAGRGGDLAQSRTRQTSGLEKPQLASCSHLLLLLQNHPSKLPNLIHVWLDCGACGAAVAVTKRKREREKARVVV